MRDSFLQECKEFMKNGRNTCEENMESVTFKKFGLMDINESELDSYLRYNRSLSFHERLFLLIERTGLKDSDIYKKARIDRRLFSKIRSNETYIPSKKTVIAFCLALELDRDEADELLGSAGYSLSPAEDYDLVIAYCIDKKVFDLFEIDEVMLHFGFECF